MENGKQNHVIAEVKVNKMAYRNCDDCKGTGIIKTQRIHFGRYHYSKEYDRIITPYQSYGPFELTQCYCVGEEEYEEREQRKMKLNDNDDT